jgi:hypothetical protein
MLGSILIQPQMFGRMQGRSSAEELADEAMALLHKLALDPAAAQALAPALQGAGAALGERLAERVRTRLPQGLAALQALIDPLVQRFVALGSGAVSAPELLGRIADALDALAGATGSLGDDAIRAFVRRVARIAEQDFGLSAAVLAQELRAFVADFRTRLINTPDAGQPATRHALACLLGRIERDIIPLIPPIDLGADRLAGLLIAELRRTGLSDLRDRAQCLLGKAQAVLRALADVVRTLATTGAVQAMRRPVAPPSAAAAARARAPRGVMRDLPSGSSVPPRSADGQYCWYASWLYATRLQGFGTDTPGGIAFLQTITPGYPEDEVWLSTDRKTLVLRRAAGDDEILHRSDTPFEWHQAPQFSGSAPARPVVGGDHAEHFVFPRIGAPFLEEWAHVTAALADVAAGMWHVVAMGTSPKEYACNIPLWLWKWAQGISSATSAPLASVIAQKAGWGMGGKYPFSPLVSMLTVIFGSLEGVHTKTNAGNGFLQWLTLLGGDALNAFTIHTITQAVRSVSLSIFTLVNYDGVGVQPSGTDTRPKNWDMAGPLVGLVNTGLGMLFFKLIRREDYGLPIGGNPTPFLLWFFVGAPLMAFVGTFSGVLVSWAFGRTATPGLLWEAPLKAAGLGIVLFLVQMYTGMEGDTDDGRYNPGVDPQGNAFTPPRQPFAGYPPAEASPYRLPLPAGSATFVGQANQGFFSHMRYGGTVQVYAYDFAHDFQDEVLAVRDGTVVDWFDFFPDDRELDFNDATDTADGFAAAAAAQTAGFLVPGQSGFNGNLTGNWNFVMIRHDAMDAVHDRDQGGTTVITFAEYGHGANGGVRAAFAARGIAPTAIIGTRVTQGHVIMQAGDTGVSFHNHLHLHVRAATAATAVPATPPPVPFPPITNASLSPYTLPFVFREGRHVLGRDGPLRHLTWYRSENTRLG